MGICKLPNAEKYRHIDLKLFPIESYYPALLHFTGSGEHNRQLRAIALKKGLMLSEYDICPTGTGGYKGDPIHVNSERDIFEILSVPFKEPNARSL